MAADEQEPGFAALVAALAKFRNVTLEGLPSDRTLARAAGVSPTTVGDWLRGKRFPQQIDPLLVIVRAIREQARRTRPATDASTVTLLEERRWRRAHHDEALRRAGGTREAVVAEQARAVLERTRPGWSLREMTDPFQLEVHRAIEGGTAGLPDLPVYVPREHDQRLAQVVAETVEGARRIAVLVGGSSTGKTRACWEALHLLRNRPEPWRLWHPIDPTRPDAALAELARIGPYTVVWLNEAQLYLAPNPLGEQVAAGLRNLRRTPGQGHVLVLATLWPEQWDSLTIRPSAGQPDRHAQARELLDGHNIRLPDAFTAADLETLAGKAEDDPRLAQAGEHARDGQIAQYLAGGPVLLNRYQQAPPATTALIEAAMDARRLGAGPRLPLAWLAEAAPGYLTDTQWEEQTGADWLQQALDYVTTPCNGIPGILIPVKTGTPRNQRTRRTAGLRTGTGSGTLYRLADYLDQHGRRHRADQIPPIDFWTAVAAQAHHIDLKALGDAAWARGLYRDATQLLKKATSRGDYQAALSLLHRLRELHLSEHEAALWAARHADLDNPSGVAPLLRSLHWVGADDQLTALAKRVAAHVDLDSPYAMAELLHSLHSVGATDEADILLDRHPVANADVTYPGGVAALLYSLHGAGADDHVAALAERAALHTHLSSTEDLANLLDTLHEMGAYDQLAVLLARNPAANADVTYPDSVVALLDSLHSLGAGDQVTALAERAAADVGLGFLPDVTKLLNRLQELRLRDQATALAQRAAPNVDVTHPSGLADLLNSLHRLGADDQVTVLAERASTHTDITKITGVNELLASMRRAGANNQAAAVNERFAAFLDVLVTPDAVAALVQKIERHAAAGQADERLPALGLFDQFLKLYDHRVRFRYGREPDGSPADPWSWDDLE